MKATPMITADFEEYPELRTLMDAAVRRVVELMEIHGIVELKRIYKKGVYDRPYVKDIVTPIGLPAPSTVTAAQYAAGQAMLSYLETIGVHGISLELTQEDVKELARLWTPDAPNAAEAEKNQEPTPVKETVAEDISPKTKKGSKK